MRYRIGCFVTLIGLLTLLTFSATMQADSPAFSLFCVGAFIAIGGAVLMWRGYQKPAPSGRFSTINKFRNRPKQQKNTKKGQ